MRSFNVNESVFVQLTDVGKAELERQHNELLKVFPSLGEYKPKPEDEEGWSEWQLWRLMKTFGHIMGMTNEPPFNTTIRIPDELWTG